MSGRWDISELENAALESASSAALRIFEKIVSRTPVDTGKARDSWTLKDEGDAFVVENDVPYIGALERGHSKQAPGGMVAITLAEERALNIPQGGL